MITIKSYTDLNQSKKLAKILPLKSADMFWYRDAVTTEVNPRIMNYTQIPELQSMYYSPCWSLTALLDVVSEISLNSFKDGNWNAMVKRNNKMIYSDKDNPVDACVAMIEKLNELNLLWL